MESREEYIANDFKYFLVIGLTTERKRFRFTTENGFHALSINLWNGRVWGILKNNGKRILLKRVVN